jgi:hypothetical protein
MSYKITSNIKKAFQNIRKDIRRTYSIEEMEAIGEAASEMVRVRTRLGYGVKKPNTKRERLKKLSEEYIETRKDFGALSEFTTPARSNLTRTGQLLESIAVLEVTEGNVEIGPQGARDDNMTNEKLAEHVSVARPFISLSNLEVKKLVRFIEKNIIKKVFRR